MRRINSFDKNSKGSYQVAAFNPTSRMHPDSSARQPLATHSVGQQTDQRQTET